MPRPAAIIDIPLQFTVEYYSQSPVIQKEEEGSSVSVKNALFVNLRFNRQINMRSKTSRSLIWGWLVQKMIISVLVCGLCAGGPVLGHMVAAGWLLADQSSPLFLCGGAGKSDPDFITCSFSALLFSSFTTALGSL